jgi:RNA polymerase sigma factor (TIGR02999 family)
MADQPNPGAITRLLHAHRDGDRAAFDELVEVLQRELRVMARQQLRRVPPGQTLDTLSLVNEAYLRMIGDVRVDWQDRAHFFAVVSRAMRWILVDRARRAGAVRRGGGLASVALDSAVIGFTEPADTVLAIHRALELLESFNARLARLVECRFFAGMSEEEIAEALGISVRTVQRDWTRARAWLQRALDGAPA